MNRCTLASWAAPVLLLSVAACGGDSGSTPDATMIDADLRKVVALPSCGMFVDATIMDSASSFIPVNTTVPPNGIVKFVMTAEHTVIPNTLTTTDPELMVSRGQTKCFQFKMPGTYGFACGVHGFAGTVTVQ